MNTLSYLSRQFDVLASSRSPSDNPQLKRSNTWSTKSFLFPQASHHPKRSLSSPPDFLFLASVTKTLKSSSQQVPIPSRSALDSVIQRLFFIRLFVLVCRLLSAAWASVAARRTTATLTQDSSLDSDTDGKDADDSDSGVHPVSTPSPAPAAQSKFRHSLSPPTPTSILYFPRLAHVSDRISSANTTTTTTLAKSHPDPTPLQSLSSSAIASLSASPPAIPTTRTPTPVSNRKPAFALLPKTLVLDLDETLIHSTSRPLPSFSSSRSSGLLGLGSLGGRNKGAGHTVEVVMGGRSTLYHVYKRPFVDFFLRTVSDVARLAYPGTCRILIIFTDVGLGLVHPRHIHRVHAGIRRSSHRLARCRPRDPLTSALPRRECSLSLPRRPDAPDPSPTDPVMHTASKRILYQESDSGRAGSFPRLSRRQFAHQLSRLRRCVRRRIWPCFFLLLS